MKIIWHSTAAVEIQCDEGKILFDPFFPLKGSEIALKEDEFDGFSDIFITHGHFDHICSIPEVVRRNPHVRVHCTRTPYETLRKKGVPEKNLIEIAHGEKFVLEGFEIDTVKSCHAVLPKASLKLLSEIFFTRYIGNIPFIIRENRACDENGETVFYIIRSGGKTIQLMGSLNLQPCEDYGKNADLLILPYNGWEDNFPPACRVIDRLKPKRVLLDHYDITFPPVTRYIDCGGICRRYDGLVSKMEMGEVYEV